MSDYGILINGDFMIKKIFNKIKDIIISHKLEITVLLYALLSSALCYYTLELGNKNPLMNGIFYTFINILTVFVLLSAVFIFVRRWWIAVPIISIPLTILSIANYYTLLYRNSPISTQDIHNMGTTLSVIDSYQFPLNIYVIAIVVLFILNIAVTVQLFKHEKVQKRTLKKSALQSICLLLFGTFFLHGVYFAENPIKPRNTFVWSWESTYYKYGYAASSIEVFQNSLNMLNKPENYSTEELAKTAEKIEVQKTKGNTPDIILILNETFYDIRDLVDIETDAPVMPFIDSLPTKGKTVVAGTGGGTNKSEYELLTSNSLQLMPAITPFNYLNFDNANSIVSYAKDLGYRTWAAHCAEALNYGRGLVYPKLGFDKVLFDKDFPPKEKLFDRPYATDEFCYSTMLEDYESMGDNPRLMYLLTIQNHGGWELNPTDADTVHSLTDFGEYTDDLNEFLSCIQETDRAFKALTEYFENSNRDVIICMVGDHAPSFATSLVDNYDVNTTFNLRTTPFVVWSNFDMNYQLPDEISMPMIVPSVIEAADMPLSVFYSQMLKVREKAPVLTAFNLFKTTDGEIFNYSDETMYKNNIDVYMNMVYNNVKNTERLDSIFMPEK